MHERLLGERRERAERVNVLLDVIAGTGRHFFRHEGDVSRVEVDDRGRVWWVDAYSGKRVFTHYKGSWRGFTNGGTLRDLVVDLRRHICTGTPVSPSRFGPWPDWVCGGDLWGYGSDMQTVRGAAELLGITGAAAVSERGLVCTAEDVRGLLAGLKTQLRRAMKPQPPAWVERFGWSTFTPHGQLSGRGTYGDQGPAEKHFRCPYGVPGDRLWVRETWRPIHHRTRPDETGVRFRADDGQKSVVHSLGMNAPLRWRPSNHMPRWASRLTLEVTVVGIERVQDTSEADAVAEGVRYTAFEPAPDAAREAFRVLWDSINEKRGFGWAQNPWVWVVGLQVLEASDA